MNPGDVIKVKYKGKYTNALVLVPGEVNSRVVLVDGNTPKIVMAGDSSLKIKKESK